MWAFVRVLRLFTKSLANIADELRQLRELYELDLESRGIHRITATGDSPTDRVEVLYGHMEIGED